MSENVISFDCADCGTLHTVEYGEEETDDDGEPICGECAGPNQWEDLDFPYWIEEEVRLDNWRLADLLMYAEDIPIDEVPGRGLKCNVFIVWFKVNKDGSVEGPYDKRKGGKI